MRRRPRGHGLPAPPRAPLARTPGHALPHFRDALPPPLTPRVCLASRLASRLAGFIKSGLSPVARAIASPFAAIIGLAFASGPVADIMIDVVVIMIITGIVKRSMPGALKMVRQHARRGGFVSPYLAAATGSTDCI